MSVIFSSNITLNTQPGDVANRPRILVDNVFQLGTVTASSEVGADNGWLENAVDGGTYDWWKWTTTPAWLEVTLTTAQPVDMCAIGLHTGLTFVYQYWDGSAWVDLHDTVTTTTTAVHAVIFAEVTASKYRIYISAADDENILGIVMLGKSLQFPKTFHGGHAPITLNRTTQIVRNRTENGFDAGVYSLRTGAATSVEISNIKPSWIRDNIELLNKDLEIRPFIFAWRPSTYPNDVAYCWLNSPITANNSGPKDYMSMRFDVQAFVGGSLVPQPVEFFAAAIDGSPGLFVYNYAAKEQVATDIVYESGASAVAFSNDGTMLAVSGYNSGTIDIYNTTTWELTHQIDIVVTGVIGDIDFSPDNTMLVATTDQENHNPVLYELSGESWVGVTIPQIDVTSPQWTPCTFSRSGSHIFVGSVFTPRIHIYSVTNPVEEVYTIDEKRAASLIDVNPDNLFTAGAEGGFSSVRNIGFYDSTTSLVDFIDNYNTYSISYNKTGNYLLISDRDDIVVKNAVTLETLYTTPVAIPRACFGRVGNKIFAASQSNSALYVYANQTLEQIHSAPIPNAISGIYRVSAGALGSSWPIPDPWVPPTPPVEPIPWDFWIDASSDGALTLDGSSNVEQWNDISGNNNHVVQTTSGLRPSTTTVNGLTAVVFAGTERMTHSYVQSTTTSTTTVAVVDAGAQTGFRGIFSPNGGGFGMMVLARSSTSANWGSFSGAYLPASSSVLSAGVTAIMADYNSVSNTTFRRDGAADGTAAAKGSTQAGHVGGIAGQEFQGTICEIRVIHRELTTDEIDRTFGELAHKWGFAASLPAEHPYKDAPP